MDYVAFDNDGYFVAVQAYDAVDIVDVSAVLGSVVGFADPHQTGDGLEFQVYRAWHRKLGDVAIRVPKYRVYRMPGRVPWSAKHALAQEFHICRFLHGHGFPVAEPLELLDTAIGVPVLVSRYVPVERHGATSAEIGGLLARLHALPVPDLVPVDDEGHGVAGAVARRLDRRWTGLRGYVPDLGGLPRVEELAAALRPLGSVRSVLHLDVRACNLLSVGGTVAAMVDWSCVLLGHPGLELARVAEYARLPENELDEAEIRRGYGIVPELPGLAAKLAAMDAVAMLGMIFFEYAPDAGRARWAAGRAHELREQLGSFVCDSTSG